MHRRLLLLFLVIISSPIMGQTDSARTLSIDQYMTIVRQYHPTVRLLAIDTSMADARVLEARSAFDPLFQAYRTAKSVDNTDYYHTQEYSLTIPTWYGINIDAGVANNAGYKLDPSVTPDRSSYIGLQLDVLNNLLIDKRRATVQKNKYYKSISLADRIAETNNLLYDAAKVYWEWVQAYETKIVTDSVYAASARRFTFIKQAVANGERATIDTVEAHAQLATLQNASIDAAQSYLIALVSLNAYLWTMQGSPYVLPTDIIPSPILDLPIVHDDIPLETLVDDAVDIHPSLLYYQYNRSILDINRRIALQDFIPKTSIYYHHFHNSYRAWEVPVTPLVNNFQYGVKLSIPLFLSQSRAQYRLAKLSLAENDIKYHAKVVEISNKVRTSYHAYLLYKRQIENLDQIVVDYQRLLSGEQMLFDNGESSLFLINARENKLLEVSIKRIEVYAKYYASIYGLQYSMGVLR